jgi:hypothetical protein
LAVAMISRDEPVGTADGLFLIRRDAALAVAAAFPQLMANLADVRGSGVGRAAMIFDSIIEPGTGRYLSDLAAFAERYRQVKAPA